MTYYAVVDTNVVVSALLKDGSVPFQILEYIKAKKIIPLFNEDILLEYYEVLMRNKFEIPKEEVEKTISVFVNLGLKTDPVDVNEYFSDKDDVIFYQIVMSSRQKGEDSRLITGNKKHFPPKEYVVTPAEMIEIINADLLEEKKKGTD